MPESSQHGLQRVRLSEVPFELRVRAARRVARETSNPRDVLAAAVFPSERVYWVSRDKAARIIGGRS